MLSAISEFIASPQTDLMQDCCVAMAQNRQQPKVRHYTYPNLIGEVPMIPSLLRLERDSDSTLYLPRCWQSRALCRLLGVRALDSVHIQHAKEMGFKFELVQQREIV